MTDRGFCDLDRVVLLSDQVIDSTSGEQRVLPAGTSGTIVHVWGGGAAFEVEFADPVGTLVLLKAADFAAERP